jgi:hypothetical protein
VWQLDGGHCCRPPTITGSDTKKPHISHTDNRNPNPIAPRQTTGRQLDITTVMGGGYPQLGQGYPQNICSQAAGGRVVESRLGGWVGGWC